jgi:hypothetical protein
MGMHTSRSRFGEPSTDLATSLGRLLVSSAQLRHLLTRLAADDADAWAPGDALVTWTEYTGHLLELHDRILAAAAVMRFIGSSGEHLTIVGPDEVRVPADAAYIATLSRRMDRHARLGRVMAGPVAAMPEAVAV